MANNNTWNYRRIWLDSNSVAKDTFSITTKMYGPDTVGTFVGYGIDNFFWPYMISLFANFNDGVYTIDNPAYLIAPPPPPKLEKAISYPTRLGDTLTSKGLLVRTKSMNESVSVPAGKFGDCIVYDFYDKGSLVAEAYISPNRGVIRMWARYGTQQQMNELTSYVLK